MQQSSDTCYFYAMSEQMVNNELTLAMTLDFHLKRQTKRIQGIPLPYKCQLGTFVGTTL